MVGSVVAVVVHYQLFPLVRHLHFQAEIVGLLQFSLVVVVAHPVVVAAALGVLFAQLVQSVLFAAAAVLGILFAQLLLFVVVVVAMLGILSVQPAATNFILVL